MIVTDIKILSQKSTPVEDEPELLTKQLEDELNATGNGYALAAIQIGIPKRIFSMKFPLIENGVQIKGQHIIKTFVNPEITNQYESLICTENCLSFPGQEILTNRFKYVHMKDKNRPEGYIFEGLEAQIVQHEMDHLEGRTMFDHEFKPKPIVKVAEPGRNDKCPCNSGKKYKKCCGR